MIGPYDLSRIVMCSADANPHSQRTYADSAENFFPGAKWVGAVRNVAEKIGCRFVVLTTAHGLVDPHDTITPYDMHISKYRRDVTAKWEETFPARLRAGAYDLMVFYAGGCPRDEMVDVMLPILRDLHIDLLTFGRPNMFDAGKIQKVVEAVIDGTTSDELKNMLKVRDRLAFWRN
jgi:hypothetical protein